MRFDVLNLFTTNRHLVFKYGLVPHEGPSTAPSTVASQQLVPPFPNTVAYSLHLGRQLLPPSYPANVHFNSVP